MKFASFSNKTFSVDAKKIQTFYGFEYSSSLQTEKQDADKKKPSTYNKGSALDFFNINISLDVNNGVNPEKELKDWVSLKDKGIAYHFILGKKPFMNTKWIITEIQASDVVINNYGQILSQVLTLKFEEYVRAGKKKAESTGSAPGITSSSTGYQSDQDTINSGSTATVNTSSKYAHLKDVLEASDTKTFLKRINKNMQSKDVLSDFPKKEQDFIKKYGYDKVLIKK